MQAITAETRRTQRIPSWAVRCKMLKSVAEFFLPQISPIARNQEPTAENLHSDPSFRGVFDRQDQERLFAAGGLDGNRISYFAPENRACDRCTEGHESVGRVRLVHSDDLDSGLRSGAFTGDGSQCYGGTKANPIMRLTPRIDDLGAGDTRGKIPETFTDDSMPPPPLAFIFGIQMPAFGLEFGKFRAQKLEPARRDVVRYARR